MIHTIQHVVSVWESRQIDPEEIVGAFLHFHLQLIAAVHFAHGGHRTIGANHLLTCGKRQSVSVLVAHHLADSVDNFYLNLNEAIDDADGGLNADWTGDGVHLKGSCYEPWHEYLLSHGIKVK